MQGCQGVGIERPLPLLAGDDELSAIECGGIHDHEIQGGCAIGGVSILILNEGPLSVDHGTLGKPITGGRERPPWTFHLRISSLVNIFVQSWRRFSCRSRQGWGEWHRTEPRDRLHSSSGHCNRFHATRLDFHDQMSSDRRPQITDLKVEEARLVNQWL